MPIRSLPKIHQVLIRAHKLTIFLTLPPNTTIAQIKQEALSALISDVNREHADIDGTPTVSSADDFELCRLARVKDRERHAVFEPAYEILDTRQTLRDCGFTSWETLFFQFKSDEGELLPVTATLPSIDDGDVEMQPLPADVASDDALPAPSTKKGKRKARTEESD